MTKESGSGKSTIKTESKSTRVKTEGGKTTTTTTTTETRVEKSSLGKDGIEGNVKKFRSFRMIKK